MGWVLGSDFSLPTQGKKKKKNLNKYRTEQPGVQETPLPKKLRKKLSTRLPVHNNNNQEANHAYQTDKTRTVLI